MRMTRRGLKARRKQRFPHQADYAAKVGVSQETVSGWERGAYTPDPSRWEKIAELLEVPVETVAEVYAGDIMERGPEAEALWRIETDRRLASLEARIDELAGVVFD